MRARALPLLLALGLASSAAAQDFVSFSEITDTAGVRSFGTTFGVGMEDLDGDGLIDLFLARTPSLMTGNAAMTGANRLFLNRGDLTFDEVGEDAGVASACENRGVMLADYDNDGDVDVYVSVAGYNELYRNAGNAMFTEVGRQAGVDHPGIGHEGIWLDYDQDGLLDLYFSNGPKEGSMANTLYHNEGDGRFLDLTDEAGVTATVSGKGVGLLDYDRDGWLDTLVINGEGYPDFMLFANQGDGTFVDRADEAGLQVDYHPQDCPDGAFLSWAIPWDFDNDGWIDLLVGSHSARCRPQNTVFQNQGDGTFVDVTEQLGLTSPFNGDGTAVADFDNDGWLDVLFCLLDAECVLYRSEEGAAFVEVEDNGGLLNDGELPNWTISTGDVDGDGFLDVYTGNGRANHPARNHLFVNDGNDHHHLFVRVVGRSGDRSAIGARVEVTAGGITQTRWVGTRMTTFSSHGGLRQHFGLGDADTVDEVRVVFPRGGEVVLTDVAADQLLEVVEEQEEWLDDGDRDGVPDVADVCPWTPALAATDARGCAAFEGGDGTEYLELVGPGDLAVLTGPSTLSWEGNLSGYRVEIDGDTAFDHDRFELGPTDQLELELAEDALAELADRFPDGRLFWRVVGSTDQVRLETPARELALPSPATQITLLNHDLNLWDPPHVVVASGDTVTWDIPLFDEGNYNRFRHDVILVDSDGYVVERSGLLRPFAGSDQFSYTFADAGTYYVMCSMHSWPSEGITDLEQVVGAVLQPGPYRCHSGSVTVEAP